MLTVVFDIAHKMLDFALVLQYGGLGKCGGDGVCIDELATFGLEAHALGLTVIMRHAECDVLRHLILQLLDCIRYLAHVRKLLMHHNKGKYCFGIGESERLPDTGSMMMFVMRKHVLQRIKQSHNVLLRTGAQSATSAAYCSPEYEGMVRGTPRANIGSGRCSQQLRISQDMTKSG